MPRIQIADTIIAQDEKILMLRRNFEPAGKLDLMGGYVDENESPEQAAQREALEESGFRVELARKLGEYDYFDRGEKTMHVFIGKIIGGQLTESKEGSLEWIDPAEVTKEDLAFPQVHVQVIKEYLNLNKNKK